MPRLENFAALGQRASSAMYRLLLVFLNFGFIPQCLPQPIAFIPFFRFVPESVRWLLARKDYRKAKKIIKKAAHINGVELSDYVMQTFELQSPTHNANVILLKISFASYCKNKKIHENLSLKHRKMAKISNLTVSMMPMNIMRCGQLLKN